MAEHQSQPKPSPLPAAPKAAAGAGRAAGGEDDGDSRETNNVLYQAIMLHKQRENERQMAVLRENQRITETMVRKRKEANENRLSAITSCSMYTNNAKYVNVNSGKDSRIRVSRLVHPLDPDECDVYSDLVEAAEHSSITAALNHCMNQSGEIEGFSYTCSASDTASCLPLNRKMFFRCSVVECEDPCSSSSSSGCTATSDDDDGAGSREGGAASPRSEPAGDDDDDGEPSFKGSHPLPAHDGAPESDESSEEAAGAPLSPAKPPSTEEGTGKFWWEDTAVGPDGKKYGFTTAVMMDLAWDEPPAIGQGDPHALLLHGSSRKQDHANRCGGSSSNSVSTYTGRRDAGRFRGSSVGTGSVAPHRRSHRSCIDRPPEADMLEVHGMPSWKGSAVPRAPRAGRMENKQVLRLLLHQKEVKARLLKLVSKIHSESIGHEARFECMPDNTDIAAMSGDPSSHHKGVGHPHNTGGRNLFFGPVQSRKAADCANWKPEMPEYVGIYHAYVRGFNKNTKTHKLFIVTQGGCSSLCDNYFNLFVDVRNHMSAGDMLHSEETWYTNKACQRNNARILLEVAKEFNLRIPTIVDPYSFEPTEVASCTTETVCNDVVIGEYDRVTVYNKCVNPLSCTNGISCTMHPSEGVWIFKGPVQTKSGMSLYGGPFGEKSPSKVFPVCTSKVHGNYSWRCKPVPGSLVCTGTPCIIPVHDRGCTIEVDKDCQVLQDRPTGGARGDVDDLVSMTGMSQSSAPSGSAHRKRGGKTVWANTCGGGAGSDKKKLQDFYTYVDENHLRGLQEDTGWSRENGVVELVPIAVVCQREYE